MTPATGRPRKRCPGNHQVGVIILPGNLDRVEPRRYEMLTHLVGRKPVAPGWPVIGERIGSPIQNSHRSVIPKHTPNLVHQGCERIHLVEDKGCPDEICGLVWQADGRQLGLHQADLRGWVLCGQLGQQFRADIQCNHLPPGAYYLGKGQGPEPGPQPRSTTVEPTFSPICASSFGGFHRFQRSEPMSFSPRLGSKRCPWLGMKCPFMRVP